MSSSGSLEFDSVLNNRGTVGTNRSKNLRPRFGGPEESRGPPVSSVDISGLRSDIRSDFTNLQIVIHRHRIPDCFWLHLILKLSLSPLYFPREIPCFGNEAQSAHKERLRQLIFSSPVQGSSHSHSGKGSSLLPGKATVSRCRIPKDPDCLVSTNPFWSSFPGIYFPECLSKL